MTFEEAMEKHERILFKFAHKSRDFIEFDDAYQEYSMVLWNCTQNFDETRKVNFNTYLWKSCVYKFNELQAKAKTHETTSLDMEWGRTSLLNYFSTGEDIMEDELREEAFKLLIQALHDRPYGFYTILNVVFGVTQAEIADTEGVTRVWVAKKHAENKRFLKKFIESSIQDVKKLL